MTLDRENGPCCEMSIDKVNSCPAWLWDPSPWPSAAEEGPLGIFAIFVRQCGELTFANSACDWEDLTMSWRACVFMSRRGERACRSRTCVWEDSTVSRPAYLALWRCGEGVRGKRYCDWEDSTTDRRGGMIEFKAVVIVMSAMSDVATKFSEIGVGIFGGGRGRLSSKCWELGTNAGTAVTEKESSSGSFPAVWGSTTGWSCCLGGACKNALTILAWLHAVVRLILCDNGC